MKNQDDIRKLLSAKFENFEAEPQENSWEAIRFALDLKDKLSTYEAEPQPESWDEVKFATDLSRKFENYEAEPQDDTWYKIQLATQLKAKFNDYEAEPTAESWDKIRAALPINEKSLLSDKFNDYEAEPMSESWDKIMAGLVSADTPISLSEKFKNYEAEPQASTWENILLATQLGAKFKDFEAEPKGESWETIKAAITDEKERRVIAWPFAFRVGIAASIALLLGFGWLLYRNNPTNTTVAINQTKGLNSTATSSGQSKIASNKPKVIEGKTRIGKEANEIAISLENVSKIASISKNKALKSKTDLVNQSSNIQLVKRIPKRKTPLNSSIEVEKNESSIAQNTSPVLPSNTDNQEVSVAYNQNNVGVADLELLNAKNFKQQSVYLPLGEIAFNTETPMEEPEERVRRKMIFTGSVMPLQTYQALTILPQTSTYIQQVGTLNALDAQRLGVQARVGMMQPITRRFSVGASLSYAGLRQSLNYEVNNGVYEVDLTNANYTLVGVGEAVSQNKFLHTVGLKLDNSYLVSDKKHKVFVLGGAEAVRILNNKEYAYYLNASVALAYPLKGGKTVWIEPTYRYSLSQSLDVNSYMQIRPSNIGLNVRVNFM